MIAPRKPAHTCSARSASVTKLRTTKVTAALMEPSATHRVTPTTSANASSSPSAQNGAERRGYALPTSAPQERRRHVSHHSRGAGDHARLGTDEREADGRDESLSHVEQRHEHPPPHAEHTADVRRARVARAECAEVDLLAAGEQRRRRHRTDEIARHRGARGGERVHRGATTTASIPGPTCAPTTAPTSL